MQAYYIGKAPKSKHRKIKIGNWYIGIGIADFSNSKPRFGYFGKVYGNPNWQWSFLIRIWDFAIQISKGL